MLGDGRGEDPDVGGALRAVAGELVLAHRGAVEVDLAALGDVLGRHVAVERLQQGRARSHPEDRPRPCGSSRGSQPSRSGRPWSRPASFARSIRPLSLPHESARRNAVTALGTARRCAAITTLEHRAQVPQQRVVAQVEPAAQVVAPLDPPVPVLVPIIRSTITTCRARQAAASSSCCDQRLGEGPHVGVGAPGRARPDRTESRHGVVGPTSAGRAGPARRGTRPTASARPAGAAAGPARRR